MAKPWLYVIAMLLAAVITSVTIWKRDEESENRLSQVFASWWLTLLICAGILYFTKQSGEIYFLIGSGLASIACAVTDPKKSMFNLFGSIGFVPSMIGMVIGLKGNLSLSLTILLPMCAFSGLGLFLDHKRAQKEQPQAPQGATVTTTKRPTRTGRGPQRGGGRR